MPKGKEGEFEFEGFLSETADGLVVLIPDHLVRAHRLTAGMMLRVTVRYEAKNDV